MTQITSGRRLRLLALGLAVTLLIALVALASRSSEMGGEGRANAGPVIAILHMVEIIAIAVELLALLLLVVILRLARGQSEEEDDDHYQEPRRLHWAVKLLIVALPLLQIAAVIFALYRFAGQPPEIAPTEFAPLRPAPGGFIEQVSANLGLAWWEIALAVALAAAAFIAIIRAFREPPPAPRTAPESSREAHALASAVAAGLRDARLEPDPRRAVIAAYATMEQMLAAQGFPRRAVEAPLEYMARLFGQMELEFSGEAMRTLTDLFELARFSDHDISPVTKERAISALQVIENELQMAR
jgi:hypothetical protein